MTGTDFITPIKAELQDFEERLHRTVRAGPGPVAVAVEQILEAGGKRLRPSLVFLAAGLGRPRRMDDVHRAAMAIEFIHNATLIHDDLIDGAPTRRGLRTIHESLGANPAIIIGDYYFAKGANLMSQIGNTSIDALLSQTVMTICFGELLQLTSQRRYDQTLDEYYAKIERKTAVLLGASTFCGAVPGHLPEPEVQAIRRFRRRRGLRPKPWLADILSTNSSSCRSPPMATGSRRCAWPTRRARGCSSRTSSRRCSTGGRSWPCIRRRTFPRCQPQGWCWPASSNGPTPATC